MDVTELRAKYGFILVAYKGKFWKYNRSLRGLWHLSDLRNPFLTTIGYGGKCHWVKDEKQYQSVKGVS